MISENACKEKLSDSIAVCIVEIFNLFPLGSFDTLGLFPSDTKLSIALICILAFIWLVIIAIEIKRKNYKCYYAYIFAIGNICYLLTK